MTSRDLAKVRFAKAYKSFHQRYPNLDATIKLAFDRTISPTDSVDRVVFLLGELSLEDFQEILFLCGQSYGSGALKILRGMYERVVTSHWLHSHPVDAPLFLEFHWVHAHRLLEAVRKSPLKKLLDDKSDEVQNIQANFERVKREELFEVTDCKRCKSKKLNHTWSTTDFVSMAAATGGIGEYLVPAYYVPLMETHPTLGAMLSRLKTTENGHITFDAGPQDEWAGRALKTAHMLLLHELLLQRKHFGLAELEEPLKVCARDYKEIWPKP